MTKRRFALALILGLLVAGVDLHAQTFTAQIQQFWNLLRTGGLQITTLNAGTIRVPNTLATTGSATGLLFPTAQLSGTEAFALTFGASVNAGDGARGDIAAAFGWNVIGDGSTPRVSGEPSIMWRFENYFRPAATACNTSAHGCQEAHLQDVASDGTVLRAMGVQIIDNPKNVAVTYQADAVSFLDQSGSNQYLRFTPGAWDFLTGAVQRANNNYAYILQLNNAGTRYNALIFTNNLDNIVLGDSNASGTKGFLFRTLDTAQLEYNGGTAPTCVTNCGTPGNTVAGNNISGRITMGTTPASGFVLTFNGTWLNAPRCSVWMSLGTMVTGKKPIVVVTTTGQFTVTTDGTAPVAGDTYDYHCESN